MTSEKEKIQNLLGLVRRRYPGWAGFSDERFVNDEINYKRATAAKAREQLSEAELRRLIDAGRFDELIERLERIGRDNNLLFQAVPLEGDLNVLYQDGLDKESFCRAVLDLLYGEGPTPERLDRYAEYVSSRDLPNKWTFPTYLLFFCHPDEEMFVKPRTVRWFLDSVAASEKLTKKPNGDSYAGVKAAVTSLREALAEFEPADMVDVQSFIWVAASEDREEVKGVISAEKREEFSRLFEAFAESYPATPGGQRHIQMYEKGREEGRRNYEKALATRDRGEDITDLVLIKLLPYADNEGNRRKGAWISIAPTIQGDLRAWFQNAGWAKEEDWPRIAEAILAFFERCVGDSSQLAAACGEFSALPYAKGMQTGFLTPILNALRPDDFLLINNKSRRAVNYFTGESYAQRITDYAGANATGRKLVDEVTEEIRSHDIASIRESDIFDMFSHWLWAEKKYWDRKKEEARYWKIAPGEDAWNWDACKDGGYIAVGWDELGDLSAMTRKEFEAKRDELVAQFDDWTKAGTEQVWKFAHLIKEGDRVIANRGTAEVVGIGTVTGPYYYVAGKPHGHRLPVEWEDTRVRKVDEYGWRRTLIKLDRAKFETIGALPPRSRTDVLPVVVKTAAFSQETFQLLADLHKNPNRDFYNARKEKFKEHLEEPLRQLFKDVARELAPPVTDFMETERNIQARILKNDWGRGGAWDFLWGAFYPKRGKRTEDAQLFVVVQRNRLEYGFYIGEYGSEQRERFIRNCTQNREALVSLLRQELSAEESLVFGEQEEPVAGPGDRGSHERTVDWKAWLADPGGTSIRAGVSVGKAEVLAMSSGTLSGNIADTFNKLFPFVLLAAHEAPMPAIQEYIEGEIEKPPNPEYSLEECATETCFDQVILESWVRAIERKKQAIIYGPPGTSKTFLAEHLARHLVGGDDGFVEVVQFHPAYAYEDFVQGLRPRGVPGGGLDYPVVPGRFLRFCEEAAGRSGVCVLIIDEINRANLARVFGELMYLLEYRDKEVPLAAGRKFQIPDNVRVIGTMNTADRSIALVDHALRRRFAFLELYPDYEVLRKFHEKNETGFAVDGLINTLKQLNNTIGDRHYHVGITYFLRSDLREQIEDIWRMEVSPYLEEFFFDEPEKAAKFNWEKVKETISP